MKKYIALSIVCLAALALYFLPPPHSLWERIAGIRKEIITNSPLRSSEDDPNSVLTHPGIISATNEQRQLFGLPALKENAELNVAADLKVKDMFEQQYFEHTSPTGDGPGDFAKEAGYAYIIIGENLALGNFKDDKALLQAWMDSPGHRANILMEKYQEIGVAAAQGEFEGRTVWLAVQEFGKPQSSRPSISAALKDKIDEGSEELDDIKRQLDNLKNELDSQSSFESRKEREEYNQKVAEYNELAKSYQHLANIHKKSIDEYNAQVRAFNACIE